MGPALIMIVLLLMSNNVDSTSEQNTYLSPTGLAFLKEDDVIITGDSWTIVMVINATQHMRNAEDFQTNLQQMESEMIARNISNQVFSEEMKRLKFIAGSLFTVNEALYDMLGKSGRNKRSLFNFVRPLFGAASTSEVNILSQRVCQLQGQVNVQQSFINYQISISKSLNKKVEENANKLFDITNLINNEIMSINSNIERSQSEIEKLKINLSKYTNLATSFRLLESIGLHSLILANRFHSGLEMAAEGKLSFSLITAKELQHELIGIHLPNGLKFLAGQSIDDMYKYREVGEVISFAQDDLIMISIKLPLFSENRGFHLYQMKSVPVRDEESGVVTRIDQENDYFILSYNNQYFGLMSFEDVRKCKGSSPKICPALLTLTNKYAPTCASLIYFKEKSESIDALCKRSVLLNDYSPIWIPDKENMGWIFSVAQPTKATLHCDEKHAEEIELIGTNILANVSHCTIIGRNFKIFRTTEGISYSNGTTFTLTTMEKLGSLIKPKLVEKLSNKEEVDKAVEGLRQEGLVKDGLGGAEEVSLAVLAARVEEDNNCACVSSWKLIGLPAFVSLTASLAATYLVLYYDKNHTSTNSGGRSLFDRIPNPFNFRRRRNRRPSRTEEGEDGEEEENEERIERTLKE